MPFTFTFTEGGGIDGGEPYAWARACLRSRSNTDAMTLFSVLMVSVAEDSFSSSDTRTRAPLLIVCAANLQRRGEESEGQLHSLKVILNQVNNLSRKDKMFMYLSRDTFKT